MKLDGVQQKTVSNKFDNGGLSQIVLDIQRLNKIFVIINY